MGKPGIDHQPLQLGSPGPLDWGRGLAVSALIGGALGGQGRLGQGDIGGALAVLMTSLVMAVALAAAARVISWLTEW